MNQTFSRLRNGLVALAMGLSALPGASAAPPLTLASTTSTQASGLFSVLLPEFTKDTGFAVKVVAVGTGQAIDMARRGDADVLLVHNQRQEEEFVAQGFGLVRHDVMYNDFVLIGPKSDPARAAGRSITQALSALAKANAPFVSRGDNSGTHAAELRHWATAQVTDKGKGYADCGCGMGAALNIAAAQSAYVLSDRASWANFSNRGDLGIVVEGDSALFNQYGVIAVNPAKHPHVNHQAAQSFAQWVTAKRGQEVIASYRIKGQQLFFPNAR